MTFAGLVQNVIWYINSLVIPLIFILAFVAFLWGIFMYLFYQQKITEARNIIVGGVAVLAIMVSIWGILSILRNSILEDAGGSTFSSGNSNSSYTVTEGSAAGSLWDDVTSFFGGSSEPQFTEPDPDFPVE